MPYTWILRLHCLHRQFPARVHLSSPYLAYTACIMCLKDVTHDTGGSGRGSMGYNRWAGNGISISMKHTCPSGSPGANQTGVCTPDDRPLECPSQPQVLMTSSSHLIPRQSLTSLPPKSGINSPSLTVVTWNGY